MTAFAGVLPSVCCVVICGNAETAPGRCLLKLRVSSGLEARHIVCRWREPPEQGKYINSGPQGRHNRSCVGPSGLSLLYKSQTGGSRHRHWICRPSGPDIAQLQMRCPELSHFVPLARNALQAEACTSTKHNQTEVCTLTIRKPFPDVPAT